MMYGMHSVPHHGEPRRASGPDPGAGRMSFIFRSNSRRFSNPCTVGFPQTDAKPHVLTIDWMITCKHHRSFGRFSSHISKVRDDSFHYVPNEAAATDPEPIPEPTPESLGLIVSGFQVCSLLLRRVMWHVLIDRDRCESILVCQQLT